MRLYEADRGLAVVQAPHHGRLHAIASRIADVAVAGADDGDALAEQHLDRRA